MGLRLRAELLRYRDPGRCIATAKATVRMRFAEVLNPDGTLYTDNLRTAKATDTFILSGEDADIFTPLFHLPRLPLRGADRLPRKAGTSTP